MRTALWYMYFLATPFLGALMALPMLEDFSMYAEDAVLGWSFFLLISLPVVSVFAYKGAKAVCQAFQIALHRYQGISRIAHPSSPTPRTTHRPSKKPRRLTKKRLKQRSARV